MLADFQSDVRYALRKLARSPLFAGVAIGTLALGIAAVTTIFSIINGVWFRSLPYAEADRTFAISERGWWPAGVSAPAAREILRASDVFERITIHDRRLLRQAHHDRVEILDLLGVDTAFQGMFRLQPQIGRLLAPEEIIAGASVAVISDTLWRTMFNGDSTVIGRRIGSSDRYTIVGVMPRGFRFPWQTDVFVPLRPTALAADTTEGLQLVARLRSAGQRDAAQASLDVITARLRLADSARYARARLELMDEMLHRRAEQFMPQPTMFLAAAFLVLLVACTNVGNLFLARAAERRGEMAVRGSLGASRLRLARQAITESLMVALAASLAGVLLSVWMIQLILRVIPTQGFPSWLHFGLDLRVLAFAVLVTVLVTLVVGLAPARQGTRIDLARALKLGGDGGLSRAGTRRVGARGLVVQLSLALVLTVAGALLVRSYQQIGRVDLGYPAAQVATVGISWDQARYPEFDDQMRFVESLFPRVSELPGAQVVTARGTYGAPRGVSRAALDNARDRRLFVDGDTTAVRRANARMLVVADGFFEALDLALLRGRGFLREDALGSAPVMIVSRTFADRVFGPDDPLGRTIQIGAGGQPHTVVGVVEDVRDLLGGRAGLRAEPRADAYVNARQASSWNYEILVRASDQQSAEALHGMVASLVRNEDPLLDVFRGATLASQVDESLFVTRVLGGLLGIFAGIALLLAVIGVYAMVAYGVSQRTREIGVRLALGGTSAMVVRAMVGEGLRVVIVALGIGVFLAALAMQLLRVLLFGVSPLDPAAYVAAVALLGAVALLACWLPARRASAVDPVIALRAE